MRSETEELGAAIPTLVGRTVADVERDLIRTRTAEGRGRAKGRGQLSSVEDFWGSRLHGDCESKAAK